MSAVATLVVWEDLPTQRIELRNSAGEVSVIHVEPDQEKDASLFHDSETGVELEVVDKTPLVEWFANHYGDFGATLEFITDRSQEGSQFVRGFGGVGGLLRWKVDFVEMAEYEELDEDDFM